MTHHNIYFKGALGFFLLVISVCSIIAAFIWINNYHSKSTAQQLTSKGYLGSSQCRSCHEKFYQLWAPSHHGQAMQPYTREFARKHLADQDNELVIGPYKYRAVIEEVPGYVLETGPDEGRKGIRSTMHWAAKTFFTF